jgi:hypothetical protein
VLLVPAAVVRLVRTLAHFSLLEWRASGQSTNRVECARYIGATCRQSAQWSTRTAHPRTQLSRVSRGHAAPVDAGSTDQRYAGGARPVKLDRTTRPRVVNRPASQAGTASPRRHAASPRI